MRWWNLPIGGGGGIYCNSTVIIIPTLPQFLRFHNRSIQVDENFILVRNINCNSEKFTAY